MSEINVDAIKNKAGTGAATIDNSGNTTFSGSNTTVSGNLKVNTIQDTTGTTGLSINSTGRVTNPNKIAFLAIGNNGSYVTTSPVIPPTVKFNYGSGYDNSSGRFTVPAGGAGLYWFHAHFGIVLSGAVGGNIGTRFYFYNAAGAQQYAPYSYWNQTASGNYGTGHLTTMFDMAVGDYVGLYIFHSNGTYYADASELSFQGMLIG